MEQSKQLLETNGSEFNNATTRHNDALSLSSLLLTSSVSASFRTASDPILMLMDSGATGHLSSSFGLKNRRGHPLHPICHDNNGRNGPSNKNAALFKMISEALEISNS
jgi:hypothetical protein